MIKAIVAGAAGRMGGRITQAIQDSKDVSLAGAFDRPGHPSLGQDVGLVSGIGPTGIFITDSLNGILDLGQVIIDFTQPEASLAHIELAADAGKAMIVGTTGFSPPQIERIRELSHRLPLVFTPNMSVGVNLLFKIVADVAKILGSSFDVEIVEAHHRLKKDAPSGTAVKLADVIAEATGRKMSECGLYGRQGLVGQRTDQEIAVLAVRAGDIVGEHTVMFGGMGERLEIIHRAHSRDTFARGAVRAAAWIAGRPAGLYDMQDVLGLK
ncbi:MAG: 4-hydroxy-tetrahydrodipicolinate reductase [Deltaproteobacteria bacterium]|nr:4-hydroxy-tetrahydrodipicolinate reductase [Deltaproteobacteria bacterium]